MVRVWLRHLFGETRKKSLPKSSDPTFSPVFEQPVVNSTPMWRSSLRLANLPTRVDYDDEQDEDEEYDEVADFQPMWYYKTSPHPPGCDCCIEGTGFPRPPSSVLSGSDYAGHRRKTSRASTHISTASADSERSSSSPGIVKDHIAVPAPAPDTNVRLRRSVSSFGLRMKKSMGSLNRRPSGMLR
ncbi:hypothetical protein KVR01_001058 [Diaporthe batatas]|uniref:uncharacterized protein n=1 Tax=Diaporthe batatas TaxID=748121 RepID=UPI001D050C11|nr:uncharacterized protein KVR01_001058 [Diaporthe batatas]KAG8170313.1 hypothetical protein KVR01_001058 [Diaporthe batatas]